MSVAKPRLFDIVKALLLRESRGRYGRRKIGYVWGLIEPGMYVVIALTIFYITGRKIMSPWPMPFFILSGMAPWLLFFRTDNYVRHTYGSMGDLLYHPVLVPFHFLLVHFLVEACTVIIFILVSFTLYGVFFNDPIVIPRFVGPIVEATLLALLFGLGVGSCLAPLMVRFPGFAFSLGYFIRVLFLTAGVFYIPEYAPTVYRSVIYYNPMTHVVALFRQGFTANYPAQHVDPAYALFVASILILVGLVAERFFVRKWAMH